MEIAQFNSIGECLKFCRNRARLKQAELAHLLNINQSDVSKYERGEKQPVISLFQDWTVKTQSMEIGIAYLYGAELINRLPDIMNTFSSMIAGFVRIGGFM